MKKTSAILVLLVQWVFGEVWIDPDTYLMWEIKTEDNMMKEYSWEDANRYCNDLELEGFDDWWLPSTSQLKSLSNIDMFGQYKNSWEDWYIENEEHKNNGYFIKEALQYNMGMEGDYWSLSDYATSAKSETEEAWYVDFEAGYDDWTYTSSSHYVRCVRSAR